MSAKSEHAGIEESYASPEMLDSLDSNDPYNALVYDERSAKAVQLVRHATLWIGNLPEAALRGLSTQGACAVSALFPGKDVVAVTVRRKEDIGTKRKSWALVTFGSEELAMEVLDESTPECVAENVFEGAFLPITMWLNAFNCVFPAGEMLRRCGSSAQLVQP